MAILKIAGREGEGSDLWIGDYNSLINSEGGLTDPFTFINCSKPSMFAVKIKKMIR